MLDISSMVGKVNLPWSTLLMPRIDSGIVVKDLLAACTLRMCLFWMCSFKRSARRSAAALLGAVARIWEFGSSS